MRPGTLCIRTGDFPPSEQKMQGFVVGFRGSKIFCLHFISMQSIDVPQSASVYRYLEKRQIEKAYEVACLGVTDADWRHLAMTALENLETEPARKAFGRLRDVRCATQRPGRRRPQILLRRRSFPSAITSNPNLHPKTPRASIH